MLNSISAELDYLNLLLVHQTIAHSMVTVQIPSQVNFTDYFPPNRGILTNFCYITQPTLFCLANSHISSRVDLPQYSSKAYRSTSRGLYDYFKTLLRRINVYCFYIVKTFEEPLPRCGLVIASLLGFFAIYRMLLCFLYRCSPSLRSRV